MGGSRGYWHGREPALSGLDADFAVNAEALSDHSSQFVQDLREIPAGLYVAVAQVLSYVFRIRTLNPTLAARMARPDPTVGDEYADV